MAHGFESQPTAVDQRTSLSSKDMLLDMHGVGSSWRRRRIAWLSSLLLSHAVLSLVLHKYPKMYGYTRKGNTKYLDVRVGLDLGSDVFQGNF